jgi:tetratricopeptide (TPR) repeat protein
VVVLFLASGAPHGETRQDDDYRRLVSTYRQSPGIPVAVESWTTAEVEHRIDRVTDDRSFWTWQELRGAAVLHTDVWFACESVRCGRETSAHLAGAERLLLRVLKLEPGQAYYVERWYDTVGGLLRHFGQRARADNLERRHSLILPLSPNGQEAREQYRRGLLYEHDGSVGVSGLASWDGSIGVGYAGHLRRSLAGAAAAYRAALAADPALSQASLRLGRVRMLQGSRTEAAGHFERAMWSPDPRITYLAALFLGSLAELGGRFSEADRLYREASVVYPSGQAAVLARSQLLGRTGRQAEGRRTLAAFLADRSIVAEPLWSYLVPPRVTLPNLAAWLDELRAELRP